MPTNADRIIRTLQCAGVERIFGMPGGGSNADLIEAAWRAGLPYTLAQTETGSAFMAAAQGELTGKPGACIATLGPGAASIMNGVAHAYLDRAPLIVVTDCIGEGSATGLQHQALPHDAMFSTLTKFTVRPRVDGVVDALRGVVSASASLPPGPVHLDLSTAVTSAVDESPEPLMAPVVLRTPADVPLPRAAREVVRTARRPVVLVGLGARTSRVSAAIRDFCERCGVPALVTYKAKGVVPDEHAWFGGVVTNGALERPVLERADAFIGVGFDPVELLPRPWSYTQPFVSLTSWSMVPHLVPVTCEVVGDPVASLLRLGEIRPDRSDWSCEEVHLLVATQRAKMRPSPNGSVPALLPHRVVDQVIGRYRGARITVDAGAHMFPVMSLWPATDPGDALISNGLSTMGFALPAAIGAALLDRARTTIAFTGDGGLLMCLGELRTAAREHLRLRIVVFDDRELSLIRIKQVQRGYHTDGMSMGPIDWTALGTGFGMSAVSAASEASLEAALRDTEDEPGPVLIGAKIDPSEYEHTIRSLRG